MVSDFPKGWWLSRIKLGNFSTKCLGTRPSGLFFNFERGLFILTEGFSLDISTIKFSRNLQKKKITKMFRFNWFTNGQPRNKWPNL